MAAGQSGAGSIGCRRDRQGRGRRSSERAVAPPPRVVKRPLPVRRRAAQVRAAAERGADVVGQRCGRRSRPRQSQLDAWRRRRRARPASRPCSVTGAGGRRHRLAASGQPVRALAVDLLGRVRRRHLRQRARGSVERRLRRVARSAGIGQRRAERLALAIVGRGRHAETERRRDSACRRWSGTARAAWRGRPASGSTPVASGSSVPGVADAPLAERRGAPGRRRRATSAPPACR